MEIKTPEDSVLVSKELNPFFIGSDYGYDITVGYSNSYLQQNVTPGVYTATFLNNKDYLSDSVQCTVTVVNKFDTRSADNNPPYLETFQILGDSVISQELYSDKTNIVRFWAGDSSGIDTVKLFYRLYDTELWHEINVTENGNFYYGNIPILNSGNYSLKTYLFRFQLYFV